MNSYRRYLGDYMRDTMHLSIMEHGAYTLLLDVQYATEKTLPPSYEALYRLCRAMTRPEQEAVRSVADQYFPVIDGERWNPRAKREVEIAQATIEKQRQSGVESASKRWSTDRSTHESTDAAAIQPPTTNLQPLTSNLNPPTSNPQPRTTVLAAVPRPKNGEAKSSPAWEAYSGAYLSRYGVKPTRNAKSNANLAQFVDRIPAEEAPAVAAFFLTSNKAYYVQRKHPTEMLLKDAEAIRTEWAIGRAGTETEARQADRTAATGNVFGKLIEEARNGSK